MPREIAKIELPIRSSRIKKAKVVFDPSENNLPKKRTLSTASLSPTTTANENIKKFKRNRPSLSFRRNSINIPKWQQQQQQQESKQQYRQQQSERQQEQKQRSEQQDSKQQSERQQESKERYRQKSQQRQQQNIEQRISIESQSSDSNNGNPPILELQVTGTTINHDVCVKCDKFETRKSKILMPCKNCNNKVHPKCLDIHFQNFDLVEKRWRCKNCTTCKNCGESRQAGYLVTCCICVSSFHYNCHKPKIPRNLIDKSKWSCYNCTTNMEENLLLDDNPIPEKIDNKSNSPSSSLSSPSSLLIAVRSPSDTSTLSYRIKLPENKNQLLKKNNSKLRKKLSRNYSIDSNIEPEIQDIMQQLSDNEDDDDEQISILSAPLLSDSSPLPSLSSSSSISSLAQSPCSSTLPSSLSSTSPLLDSDLQQKDDNYDENNDEEQIEEEQIEEEQNEEEQIEEVQVEEEQIEEVQVEEEQIEEVKIEEEQIEEVQVEEEQIEEVQVEEEHNKEQENKVESTQELNEEEQNDEEHDEQEINREQENKVESTQELNEEEQIQLESDLEDYSDIEVIYGSDDNDDNNDNNDNDNVQPTKFHEFFASKEDVPDVSDWSCEKLANYIEIYLPEESKLFRDQEIDGKSCLLLKRIDVINGLSLQLGSALRLYSVVVALQTRQRDMSVTWL